MTWNLCLRFARARETNAEKHQDDRCYSPHYAPFTWQHTFLRASYHAPPLQHTMISPLPAPASPPAVTRGATSEASSGSHFHASAVAARAHGGYSI